MGRQGRKDIERTAEHIEPLVLHSIELQRSQLSIDKRGEATVPAATWAAG